MDATNKWLEFAEKDFNAAKLLEGENFSAACFHLQQVWEKAVKAVMIHQGIGLEKTHDIR